ncbi:3-keto-5-aminohexanoate cleavage protein [Sulfitobacter sp. S190]|uniref:3-keto-5-aminohexanoate cleavage protein n=1 Tax=Sulfitobacter sp. S190 TaxID=2867022 RepID=UPI0021A7D164|nr:3-keto-5-aminohexanoate cleavage protein [Sulfitobacter sp. S190]UWR23176.1 3-keto-5-aminohexanoate cleavage protein [Sulfitobacter sp. S190]
MDKKPAIICVAITGSLPRKSDNPAVPLSIAEQVESTHEAFEAGASIVHCHVRDDAGQPTSDPARFGRLMEGIRAHCPGMIVQFSTGGRSGAGQARGAMLPLRPDMASLSVGSVNFPSRTYDNPPDLVAWLAQGMQRHRITPEIEAFDVSHVLNAIAMHEAGQLPGTLYIQIVMGVANAMPADREVFDFMVDLIESRAPDAQWCAAGIGAQQLRLNTWAAERGGHLRTGLEDNVRLDRHTLAPSNAALVLRAVEAVERCGRRVATPHEARALLGLSAAPVS